MFKRGCSDKECLGDCTDCNRADVENRVIQPTRLAASAPAVACDGFGCSDSQCTECGYSKARPELVRLRLN